MTRNFQGMVKIAVLFAVAVLLAACSTTTSSPRITADNSAMWAMLPINNLSTTPMAGEQAKSIVESHLRARGVRNLQNWKDGEELSLVALLDSSAEFKRAVSWAQDQGVRYGMSGTVHEWHYKSGPDKEPAIGLSLKLFDLTTGQVVWQASGARTGWGYSNLSKIAGKVVDDLLDEVKIRRGGR